MVESILSLFIFQDAYVVSFLVAGIMIVVLLLLMYNFKTPESVVMNEVNKSENVEGALRRVLGEQNWVGANNTDDGEDAKEAIKKIGVLEQEILTKDKEIAELHKQVTHGGGAEGDGGNDAELMAKIDELEARLQEYEIIEDDIADLSLYKAENDKLKAQLESLKSGDVVAPEPVAEEESGEEEVVEKEAIPVSQEPEDTEDDDQPTLAVATDWPESDSSEETSGRDRLKKITLRETWLSKSHRNLNLWKKFILN